MIDYCADDFPNGIRVHQKIEELKTEVNKLRTELTVLVLKRDDLLYRECKNIETAYMLSIGGLEYKAHEIECFILRLKRKMEIIQAKKNRQEVTILSQIEDMLDCEFAEYQEMLNKQIDKMNAAFKRNSGEKLTAEESQEMKDIYRVILKALHPDLHPDLNDKKIQLFHHAVDAYEHGDLSGLRIIGEMIDEQPFPDAKYDGSTQLMNEKTRLTLIVADVKNKIDEIKSNYPYTMKSLIQSPGQIKVRKSELEAKIEHLHEVHATYLEKIEEMLR